MKISTVEAKRLKDKYGSWALITGSSSGIGREIAFCLAEAGFNLIINSRNSDSLNKLKSELEKNTVEIKIIESDLSSIEGAKKLTETSANYDIGLLVTSAGFGTSGLLLESNIDEEINMLRVNCESVLYLTHFYAKYFANKGKGGIILFSSLVAFQGVPYAANYSATKAYIQSLAEGLAIELKPYNVDVLACAPGPVESGFSARANMQMGATLKPEDIGASTLKSLGKRTTVLPGFLSKFLIGSLHTVPRAVRVLIMKQIMGSMTEHQR